MKNLRAFSVAAVLTCMLAQSTFAGDISFPVAPPPAQPTSTTTTDVNVTGHIEIGIAASDSVTEAALNVISSVLTLL